MTFYISDTTKLTINISMYCHYLHLNLKILKRENDEHKTLIQQPVNNGKNALEDMKQSLGVRSKQGKFSHFSFSKAVVLERLHST